MPCSDAVVRRHVAQQCALGSVRRTSAGGSLWPALQAEAVPELGQRGGELGRPEVRSEVIGHHPQLLGIVAGHLHRTAASTLSGRPVLSAPSTYFQALPDFLPADFDGEDFGNVGPPGFALHVFRDGELSSQVELLGS